MANATVRNQSAHEIDLSSGSPDSVDRLELHFPAQSETVVDATTLANIRSANAAIVECFFNVDPALGMPSLVVLP